MTNDTTNTMTMGALKAAVSARVPVMLVGAPGTGKTETVRALARDMEGYSLITVVGSQMDPTDIVGLPQGQHMGKTEDGKDIFGTVNLAPWWQVEILKNKKVILFLDEFSNTSGATRASMLTMLQNREFPNGHVMPDETIVIGAMNPTEQAADGYELDSPTTNRIFFIPWKTSADSWFEGMLNGWGKEIDPEEMAWKRKIVGFLKDNPSYLHKESGSASSSEAYGANINDPSEQEVLRYAWSSRRSWDNLSRVLAFSPKDVSIQDMIAQGLVGYASAAQFRDWLRKNENIKPEDVLNDPSIVDWKEINPNDMSLILRALVDGLTAQTFPRVLNVFGVVADNGRAAEGASYIQDILKFMSSPQIKDPKVKEGFKKKALELISKYQNVASKATARS